MTIESPSQVQAFDWKQLLFSFEGRIRRSHFWIGWLICLGVGVVAGWLPIIGALISLALIWPNLAITVKRLHDMGHTGWLAAIPFALGVIGFVGAISMMGVGIFLNHNGLDNEDPAAVFATFAPAFGLLGLMALVGLAFLLWIGVTDTQRGDNKYGPNPKGL